MPGGLIQLIATGRQDVYLTNNPQITFFKVVYRRHTPFAINTIENYFTTTPSFNESNSTMTIPKSGDIIFGMTLKLTLPKLVGSTNNNIAWVRKIGYAIIDSISIDIGGTKIDTLYGTWLHIWNELTSNKNHSKGLDKLIGDTDELTKLSTLIPEYTLYIPLNFWFCKHIGLGIPILSLSKHNILVNLKLNKSNNLIVYDGIKPNIPNIVDSSLLIDYIYLDKNERNLFSKMGHEYLIEQIQYNKNYLLRSDNFDADISFNHPIKELYWTVKNNDFQSNNKFLCYSNTNDWSESINYASRSIVYGMCNLDINGIPIWGNEIENSTTWNTSGTKIIQNQNLYNTNVNFYNCIVNINFDSSVTTQMLTNGFSMLRNTSPLSYKISKIFLTVYNTGITIDNIIHNISIKDISIPIKEWFIDDRTPYSKTFDIVVNQAFNYGLYLDGTNNCVSTSVLTLNGQERFSEMDGYYFNYLQPLRYHTNTPCDGINIYSFSINPEKHQPSGTCNMSRITNSILSIKVNDDYEQNYSLITNLNTHFSIYGLNYNVLKIIEGYGGLSYSK